MDTNLDVGEVFKDAMPLHELVLSMMHKYAMISPTPSLVEWCGAQEERLDADQGLDAAFKMRYRSRLGEISRLALGETGPVKDR